MPPPPELTAFCRLSIIVATVVLLTGCATPYVPPYPDLPHIGMYRLPSQDEHAGSSSIVIAGVRRAEGGVYVDAFMCLEDEHLPGMATDAAIRVGLGTDPNKYVEIQQNGRPIELMAYSPARASRWQPITNFRKPPNVRIDDHCVLQVFMFRTVELPQEGEVEVRLTPMWQQDPQLSRFAPEHGSSWQVVPCR